MFCRVLGALGEHLPNYSLAIKGHLVFTKNIYNVFPAKPKRRNKLSQKNPQPPIRKLLYEARSKKPEATK